MLKLAEHFQQEPSPREKAGVLYILGVNTLLRFILGTAGSGKTTKLYRRLQEGVTAGRPAIFIVPEQHSFAAEAAVFRQLGPALSARVRVLSFTRLAHRIAEENGAAGGMVLSPPAKLLLMSIALDETADRLSLYKRQAGSARFIPALLELITELKSAGISADVPLHGMEADRLLSQKISELSHVFQAYQALVDTRFSDPDDVLERADKLLEGSAYFDGTDIYIDSFSAFMAGEYKMIARMLERAESMTVTLCTDALSAGTGGMGLFSQVQETAARLIRIAKSAHRTVETPRVLRESHRFQNSQLRAFERGFLRPDAPCYEGETGFIRTLAATDRYDEVAAVAGEILTLVREKGLRYREIAVVARGLDAYSEHIAQGFARVGIPVFMDRREDIECVPVVAAILSALEAVETGFETQSVLRFAKSGIFSFAPEQIAELENYCYVWGIDKKAWLSAFKWNPSGLADTVTEEDTALLLRINALRVQLLAPLKHLRSALSDADGEGFARAVVALLEETDAPKGLLRLYESGLLPDADKKLGARLWDAVMELLNVFATTLSGRRLRLRRMMELFRLAVLATDLGSIPQTQDQVIVGQADRIRPEQVRAVFLLGCVQGEFPRSLTERGLLTDSERARLRGLGLEIGPSVEEQAVRERFYAYFAAGLPSEYLYISYPCADIRGNPLLPSVLVKSAARIANAEPLHTHQLDPTGGIANAAGAFSALCARLGEDTPLTASLYEVLRETELAPRLNTVLELGQAREFHIADPDIALALFGRDLRLSPSRLESYYLCPFAYFCRYGLGLQPRRKAEFSPLESGSLIHFLLEKMLVRHGGKALIHLPREQLLSEIEQLISQRLLELSGEDALPARFAYLFSQVSHTALRVLLNLAQELAQSSFEPVAFEMPVRQGGEVPPLVLPLPSGGKVSVEGVVDRVDLMHASDGVYVRVVDYKSGAKTFSLSDALYGLNMQMLIYLFSIWEQGGGRFSGALPAGVLYFPARDSILSQGRDATEEELEQQRRKSFRMNGLLLDQLEVIYGMEKSGAGLYIPARVRKDGTLDSNSSAASMAQMKALSGYVKGKISGMASHLQAGSIPALPAFGAGYEGCAWCDYRSVCLREDADPVRELLSLDAKDAWETIGGEGRHG